MHCGWSEWSGASRGRPGRPVRLRVAGPGRADHPHPARCAGLPGDSLPEASPWSLKARDLELGLTRFRGHPILLKGGVHDAQVSCPVPGRVTEYLRNGCEVVGAPDVGVFRMLEIRVFLGSG